MTTARLWYTDATLREFEAEIVAHARVGAAPALVLDRTAFYPEAGGQLGDRGTLDALAVVDTQELDDGRIAHVLDPEAALPAIGARVRGALDWARRRQHMAQHTAQHLLSGTLLDRAAAATASARLGESALTIDVARDRIPEAELAAAEDLANDLIDDDLPIRAWFPPAEELATLKLRRDPKVSADIRVVAIGDFDLSPCGGTHCARTSQLAGIRITALERYKGMTRVTFVTGRRGRTELFARDRALRALATTFSCGPHEVATAVERMRRDATAAGEELARLRGTIAQLEVDALVRAAGDAPEVAVALAGDAEHARAVAAKLAHAGKDALVACTGADGGTVVVLQRATGGALDAAAVWKRIAADTGARGGGKPERAEGRVPGGIADWTGLLARVR